MKRKTIYLFLALLLPGLIFIFLKKFGHNEFDIPVLMPRTDSLNLACGTHFKDPFRVPDSVLRKAGCTGNRPCIFFLEDALGKINLDLFQDELKDNEVQLLPVASDKLGAAVYDRWRHCAFIIPDTRNTILVDVEGRLRGFYSTRSREESDRLLMEVEILLKKY
jgi:hypothetical protein